MFFWRLGVECQTILAAIFPRYEESVFVKERPFFKYRRDW